METTDVSMQPGHPLEAEMKNILKYFTVIGANVYRDQSCYTFCQDHLEMTMTLLTRHG